MRMAGCFAAAVLVHALMLFGFRMETPARPLAMSEEEPAPVDVNLVEAAPAPPAEAPPEPAPTPEPAEPQPTPEMPTPPPVPTPDQETMPPPESTPAPERPKPAPRRPEQKHARTSAPHSAPGTAAALAGSAGHGAATGSLSAHARYLSNPRPAYPPDARRQGQEGLVLLNVEVGEDGRAAGVTLKRSSGFPLLDEAAIEAVRRWRFEPARAAGFPVSSRVDVPVRFSLSR